MAVPDGAASRAWRSCRPMEWSERTMDGGEARKCGASPLRVLCAGAADRPDGPYRRTTTRFRPERFASYSATSALRTSSSQPTPSWLGMSVATPMLAVTLAIGDPG